AGLVEEAPGVRAGRGGGGEERVGARVGGDPAHHRQRRLRRRGRGDLQVDPGGGEVAADRGGAAAGVGARRDGHGDRGATRLGPGEQGAGLGRVVGARRAGRVRSHPTASPPTAGGGGGHRGGRGRSGQGGGELVAVDGQGHGLAPGGVAAEVRPEVEGELP